MKALCAKGGISVYTLVWDLGPGMENVQPLPGLVIVQLLAWPCCGLG